MKFVIPVWVAILLAICGCPTITAGRKSLAFDASHNLYRHEASGFSFPAIVGRFHRHPDISFYDESGNNFSVQYYLLTAEERVVLSVFIYPSLRDYSLFPIPALGQTPEWFLKYHFDGAKDAVIKSYNATLISESEYRIGRSLLNPIGKRAVFEWNTETGETLLSHLYLFTHKGWLVKYRFTFLSKYKLITENEIKNFIDLYEWPN